MKKQQPFLALVFVNLVIMVLAIFATQQAQAQTTLYSETFTTTDGTTSGTGSPAAWTRDIGALSPNRFFVRSSKFEAKFVTGEAVWQSQTIFIQGWQDVSVSVDMPTTIDQMEADDYINFYYKLNGGAEVAFTTNGINTGSFASGRVASHTGLKGNTLQIVARIKNDASDEDHFFDNVTVTGTQYLYYEDFAGYANGTTTSSKWSITGTGTTWSVQSNEMKGTNGGTSELVWTSSSVDISTVSAVDLSVLLRDDSDDKKENADYVSVFYKLDGGSEVQFATNGHVTNDFASPYTLTASHTGLSGTSVQIVIRMKSNANDEEFYINNVIVSSAAAPAALTPGTTPTNITCYGGSNGSIALNVTGGRAPFTYSWSTGATTQNISSLATGTYTVTVTAQNGATASTSQAITQPAAFDYTKTYSSYNGAHVSCNGSTNGSVDLTVTGNTSPYTFVWSTGAITEDISNKGAGTYTVTVTDANSCTGTTSATITQPAALSGSSIAKTNVSCIGATDGTANLTVSGGTSPYTFNWSNAEETEDLTGLATAVYTVTITDANGCTGTKSTTLTNPSAMTVSVTSSTNVLCRGNSTGAIDITAEGGTAPLTFLWSNGAITEDLTSLPAGTYTVTVTSNGNSGCTVSTSQVITQPAAALSVSETTGHISCNNYNNGTISLTPSGGTGAKTYSWTGGVTTSSRTGLSGGTYSYTVTDANACTVSDTVLIVNPTALSASLSVTHQTDYGSPNGAIDVTASGGWTPYTYLWNKQGEDITTEDRTGLQANYYTVAVTDNQGCKAVQSAMVSFMDSIKTGSYIVNMGVTPQTIANGLKPYGFVYDMVRNYKIPVEWVINGSKAKDATDFSHNGVDYKSSAFVIKEEYLDNTIENRIAYWETQGVVGDYTVSSFVAPVYGTLTGFSNVGVDQANEGLVIPYFNNASIPSSMYYVGLPSQLDNCEDAYILPHADPTWATHSYLKDYVQTGGFIWTGCHAVSMLEGINNPSDINDRMNFLSTNGLQCYNSTAGKCGTSITQYHGDPTGPYSYNSAYDIHPIMQFMGDLTPSTENGSEDLYIPQTTGGWNPGTMRAITTSDGSAGKEGTKLVFGRAFDDKENGIVMYQAGHTAHGKGTVANQVASERAFFNFILHASIYNKIIATATIPSAMSEGSSAPVSVSVSDGTPPYTYAWTTNVSGTFDNATSATTNFNLNAGNGRNYARLSVRVTDACGRNFFATKTLTVLYLDGTRVSEYNGYNVSCHGDNDGYISLDVEGGTPPYTYNWSTGANTARIDNLTAGNYYVTITDALSSVLLDTFTITQPNIVTVNLSGTASVQCFNSTNGSITSDVLGGIAPYAYLWSSGAETEDISGVGGGTYTLEVSDANGCATTDVHTITSPDEIVITPTVTNVSCYNDNDGAIDIAVTGGTGIMTFVWSNSAVTEDVSALTDGDYTVTVTDANSCTATSVSTVTEPNELILSGTTTDVSCYGANDGDVAFTSSGGTTPVIVYNFEGPHGTLPQTLTDMYGTAEWYWAIDNNGCESYYWVQIDEPDPIIISDNTTDVTCNGDVTGAIDVSVVGGVAPLTYLWSSSEVTQDLTGITNGTYVITVTDADGCTANSSITVTASSNIATALTITPESGDGANDGSIAQTVSGGVAPYTFLWTNSEVTEDISSLAPGHYTVTITDDLSCTKTASGFVMGYPYNGKYWTGSVSIAWNNNDNWSPPGVPTSADSAIIPYDAVRQPTIQAGTSAVCGFLDVRAGATLTMTSTATLSLYGDAVIYGSFVHGNGTVKFMGNIESNYYSDKKITFYNLVMQNSSATGLQMHKSFRVQNNIAFNDGLIFTNEDTIFALNNSINSLTNHSDTSFVVGKFNRAVTSVIGSYMFPLGRYVEGEKKQFHCELVTNALLGVSSITVFFDYWSEAEDKDVSFEYGDIVINRLYDEGKWVIEPNAQPLSGSYSLKLYVSNFSQITDNNFAIIKRPLGGGKQDWSRGTGTYPEANSTGRMVADGYAKIIGLTSFSEFGVGGGGGGGLPVKWLDFTGEKFDNDKVLVKWSTGSEVNNDYFTLERAADGETFAPLGTVNANGNTSTASHYSFVDKNPLNEINYYRIKQTDNDGRFDYTSIIAVMFNQEKTITANSIVNLYPNPSDGEFSIEYEGNSDTFNIYVMNMKGEIVKSFTRQIDKSKKKSLRMNLRGLLAPGAYTIIVDENHNRVFRKMVITN